jgi:hypothetical protein
MPERPRPVPPPKKPLSELDQQRISRVFGSTTERAEADVVSQVLRTKGQAKPKAVAGAGVVKVVRPVKDQVEYRCGHRQGVGELTAQNCPACRKANKEARKSEHRAKVMAKIKDRPRKPLPPTLADLGRLPAGSAKRLLWSGGHWYGVLEIPGVPKPFEFTADTEAKCFHGLDALYREHLAAPPAPQSGASRGEA